MSRPPNAPRFGEPLPWGQLAHPDAEQSRLLLAESLSQLLADLLSAVREDGSPAMAADESSVERYLDLTDTLAEAQAGRRAGLGVSRAGLAKRCVTWLTLLLTAPPGAAASAAGMHQFVEALALFPALFDSEPSARARRAALSRMLTRDLRSGGGTREAAAALIDACDNLGALLWPEPEFGSRPHQCEGRGR